MSPDLYMPTSTAEQVALLEALYRAEPQYDERLRRATNPMPEAPRIWAAPLRQRGQAYSLQRYEESLLVQARVEVAAVLVQQRAADRLRLQHQRMCREVCRGLKVAGAVLMTLAIWSATLHSVGLTALLSLLACTCWPLYLLAHQVLLVNERMGVS